MFESNFSFPSPPPFWNIHQLCLTSIQGCTNTGSLIASTTKFCIVARNIFNTTASVFYPYEQKCVPVHTTKQKATDNRDGKSSSPVWYFDVADPFFWKICGPLIHIMYSNG